MMRGVWGWSILVFGLWKVWRVDRGVGARGRGGDWGDVACEGQG